MTRFRKLEQRRYVDGEIERIHIRLEERDVVLEDVFKNIDSYSYYDGDKIIGIVGIIKINDNTCEVRTVLDECSKHYVREIYFYAFSLLNYLQKRFVRIQAIAMTNWPTAIHFLERLGFEREGLMKKFGPDGDYYLYGRVK